MSNSEERDFEDPLYIRWRKRVFAADDYTCQMCHRKGNGVRLEAHHIKPWTTYPRIRFSVANGITLCHDCHQSVYRREDEYDDLFTRLVKSRMVDYNIMRFKKWKRAKYFQKRQKMKTDNNKKKNPRLWF